MLSKLFCARKWLSAFARKRVQAAVTETVGRCVVEVEPVDLGNGIPRETAFQNAYGQTVEEFYEEFRNRDRE